MSADIDPRGFGRAADEYARHRQGFPSALLDRLAAFAIGDAGHVVVDLGTGTGTLARQFAARACSVIGIDPDERMLAAARDLARAERVKVDFRAGTAEHTGLGDASADVVTAGQCWHWFDRAAAAREAYRLLRPEGRLAICHFDWIPLPGNAVEATEELVLRHNENWTFGGGHGMYPAWARRVHAAGFRGLETFGFDVDSRYTPEAWRGRMRASAGIAPLDDAAQDAFDADLAEMLARRFPGDEITLDHRVWALVAVKPG